jgi:ribosomal protein S18 acetylase RimI-like enzyme
MPGSQREIEVESRRARERDIPAIVTLWQDLQESNTASDKRLRTNASASGWYEDFLRQQLEQDNSAVFVAEWDSAVVGYTFGQIMRRPTLAEGDCGYVADLCVADAHRGRGIGRRLYFELRSWFTRHGIQHIEVHVVDGNPASQAFWRKMGFGEFLRTLRCDV